MNNIILTILAVAVLMLLFGLGIVAGEKLRQAKHEKELDQATQTVAGILATARKEAENLKKKRRF